MESDLFESDHEEYRAVVREFVQRHVVPTQETWTEQRLIDRAVWLEAGKQGLLGLSVPEENGGAAERDYRFRMIVQPELARVGPPALQSGFSTNDDIVLNYLLHPPTNMPSPRR